MIWYDCHFFTRVPDSCSFWPATGAGTGCGLFQTTETACTSPPNKLLTYLQDPVPPLALNSIIFQKGSVKQKWICRKLQMCASFFMNTWRQRRRMKSGESSKAGEWWGMRGRRLQQWEMISILLQGLSCFSHPVLWLPFEKSAYALLFMSLFQGNKL